MVLRGTKTAPGSLREALADLIAAQAHLAKVEKDLMDTKTTVEVVSHQRQTETLNKLIEDLRRRINELEREEEASVKHKDESIHELEATVKRFLCGGFAGAVSRTCVSPIDRCKILRQTQQITEGGKVKYGSMAHTIKTVVQEEGVRGLWRGNVANVLRVMPYSAAQFSSYDGFKAMLLDKNKKDAKLSNAQRVMAGALAGITATTLTHPLDVIRLRMAVEKQLRGTADAVRSLYAENGLRTFGKGYFPSVISLAPFISLNFASFDYFKQHFYGKERPTTMGTLSLGAAAGLFAQSVCYPLDLVRRRMQLRGKVYDNTLMAFVSIVRQEGPQGLYKGMAPNITKIVPNNAIRFLAYDMATNVAGVSKAGGGE